MAAVTAKDVFDYHSEGKPGKIEVVPTKKSFPPSATLPLPTLPGSRTWWRRSSPRRSPPTTTRPAGNLVAVVSNGSAILGLGNRGPLASKPVMEGKGSFQEVRRR